MPEQETGANAGKSDLDLPRSPAQDFADESESSAQDSQTSGSLVAGLLALVDDITTFAEAEIAYQKARVALTVDRLKKIVLFAVIALFLGSLAMIGLVVGLIVALAPMIGGWAATAVVVGLLMLAIVLLLLAVRRNVKDVMGAFGTGKAEGDEDD